MPVTEGYLISTPFVFLNMLSTLPCQYAYLPLLGVIIVQERNHLPTASIPKKYVPIPVL